jgi:microcin C transport system substrate-binding protein
MKNRLLVLITGALLTVTAGCGQRSGPASEAGSSAEPVAPSGPVSTNKADYPVFPDADAGADPSVPAEQGGKGFTGKGWQTNTDFELIGDPRALKGGALRDSLPDFPGTIRLFGPEATTYFNYGVTVLAYETLLGVHPTTLEYIPGLATHWQVSPDKMTYRFRINPNARFSDGAPVTSDDVVATYDLLVDKTLEDPTQSITFGKLERPVAESKYIVRVHAKELNWRNFLYFSGMPILPAHVLKGMNGDKYDKDYNYKLMPGSGPYTILDDDIKKGQSITVRRRKDYWGGKARANVGTNNFDELRFVVVRDENLAFEMFKKGELDTFGQSPPLRARQWAEDLNFDNVQRGLIQKRAVYNDNPQGIQGFAFNTRKPPLDDIRVRKALTILLDRAQIIEKLKFNLYKPLNSYFADSPYENPDNPKNDYDPQQALKLLADAGWNSRDGQGRIVKNGVPLQFEVIYDSKVLEPELTIYQEDLRKLGIGVNLRLVTFETQVQLLDNHNFEMADLALSGLLFPNPETQWISSFADTNNNNNVTGFKNARVDQICAAYDKMFDVKERISALRELDGILAKDYQYVLQWYDPATRIAYWNKFGIPQGYLLRTSDAYSELTMWWINPAKDAALQKAMRDSSVKLEVGPNEDHYWEDYGKTHPFAQQSQQ